MPMNWSFYSLSKERWDAIFGGGLDGAEAEVVQSATWDEDAFSKSERQVVARLARSIVRNGISYTGLSRSEARLLDDIIQGFFCPEGLKDLLGFEYESPDFVSMSLVETLLARSAHLRHEPSFLRRLLGMGGSVSAQPMLPLLLTGRRLNGSGKPREPYLLLSPDEIARMHEEVLEAISEIAVWPGPGWEESARKCLLDVLARVHRKQKWFAARYC
jgi:hypothetical protein